MRAQPRYDATGFEAGDAPHGTVSARGAVESRPCGSPMPQNRGRSNPGHRQGVPHLRLRCRSPTVRCRGTFMADVAPSACCARADWLPIKYPPATRRRIALCQRPRASARGGLMAHPGTSGRDDGRIAPCGNATRISAADSCPCAPSACVGASAHAGNPPGATTAPRRPQASRFPVGLIKSRRARPLPIAPCGRGLAILAPSG